jgi:hypothetical protein
MFKIRSRRSTSFNLYIMLSELALRHRKFRYKKNRKHTHTHKMTPEKTFRRMKMMVKMNENERE